MTQQRYTNELLNDNHTIALFMGYELIEIGYLGRANSQTKWQMEHKEWLEETRITEVGWYFVNLTENKWFKENDIHQKSYHDSWDWLMPVWKRLYAELKSNPPMAFNSVILDFQRLLVNVEFEKFYLKVVFYIRWLNQNPINNPTTDDANPN